MVSLQKRMFKLTSLLTVRTGPGAAILPPGITRLTLSFNKKCYDGHSGPRHFWRSYLPRLKFHNPGVPMDVVRGEGAPGPATLTLALAGGVERVLDVRYKSAEEIWAQVRGAVRVQEVQEGVEDALLRAEVAREVAKREEVRSAVRAVVEGQRREKELLKVAREGGGVV